MFDTGSDSSRIRRLSPLLRLAAAIVLAVNAFALSPRPASAQTDYCALRKITGGSLGPGGVGEASKVGDEFVLLLPHTTHGNPEITITKMWAGQRVHVFRKPFPTNFPSTTDWNYKPASSSAITITADLPLWTRFELADTVHPPAPLTIGGGMREVKIWVYGLELHRSQDGEFRYRRDDCGNRFFTLTVGIAVPDAPTDYVVPGYQKPDPPPGQNRAPTVASAIADAEIVNESGTKQVSLSGVFSDADADDLTVKASSSDDTVATVSSDDASTLTLTAKHRGTATVTVTAADGKRRRAQPLYCSSETAGRRPGQNQESQGEKDVRNLRQPGKRQDVQSLGPRPKRQRQGRARPCQHHPAVAADARAAARVSAGSADARAAAGINTDTDAHVADARAAADTNAHPNANAASARIDRAGADRTGGRRHSRTALGSGGRRSALRTNSVVGWARRLAAARRRQPDRNILHALRLGRRDHLLLHHQRRQCRRRDERLAAGALSVRHRAGVDVAGQRAPRRRMLLTHTAARGLQPREPLAFSGRKDQALTASKTVQAR